MNSDSPLVTLEDEMSRSYMDYAMSVIIARAIPDVRDGLKPVHRRILYAMKEGGYESSKPFRKSARIVGDVMGKYHPHGDSAIYDSMVRMAQEFSMRLVLIAGQGNFGSMDGDKAAAMRYTEARLNAASEALLQDIDKNTVDFRPNYDESEMEPVVLPARIPNLLVNGAGGIAVGMATNIPPHNLGEVVDAALALLADPDISDDALCGLLPAPDFPTGGIIIGKEQIRQAYLTGRGTLTMRGKTHIEEAGKNRKRIVVTEIPYQVNKARMIEKIAELVRDKSIEGISDLRDESDRSGVRVVIEIKADQQEEVILAQLFKFTPLEQRFSINMLALNHRRPESLTLRVILQSFLDFRDQIIIRRTRWHLQKARTRAHILAGLLVTTQHIDPIIALIKSSQDPQSAKQALMAQQWEISAIGEFLARIERSVSTSTQDAPVEALSHYQLSEDQAKAILDLRLHRLTAMERDKLMQEAQELAQAIDEYIGILLSSGKRKSVIAEEMQEMKTQFATERKSEISDMVLDDDDDMESLIQREDMVVTITHKGYIKRVPLGVYRAQKRGGRGRAGMAVRDEDFVSQVLQTSTHAELLFFTDRGMVYRKKVWQLPAGEPQHRGKPLVNHIALQADERITAIMTLPEDEDTAENLCIMFVTSKGTVRRNRLSDFTNIRRSGLIAMKLDAVSDGYLVGAVICSSDDDILLSSRQGMAVRFKGDDVRLFSGRNSTGVRGIRLEDTDEVVGMSILAHQDYSPEARETYARFGVLKRKDELTPEERTELKTMQADAALAEMAENDEMILTITTNGYGKRSSAIEYRTVNRGGKGIGNINLSERNGEVAASFPVKPDDHVMMVTDRGQLIRCPVNDIRIAGRRTQGVTLFRVESDEHIVSVTQIVEDDNDSDD